MDLGLDLFSPEQPYPTEISHATNVSPSNLDSTASSSNVNEGSEELISLPVPDDYMGDSLPSIPLKYAEDEEFSSLHELPPLAKFFLCASAKASPGKYYIIYPHALQPRSFCLRVWICNQLPSLLNELPQPDAFEYLFPLTLKLCRDEAPSVKEALVQNLDEILIFYFQHPNRCESLLQLLECTLFSPASNIAILSKRSFTNFCQAVSKEILERDILPFFIELLLTHGMENSLNSSAHIPQDAKTVKVRILDLFRAVYSHFNLQTLIEVFLPVLETHCTHQDFELRKEVLFGISELLKVLPTSIILARLYPLFVGLASDSVYEIRMFACDMFVAMSGHLLQAGKSEEIVLWMNKFLADGSQKVKTAAAGALGQVLYLFHRAEVPGELLRAYFSLCKSSRADIRISCAFNLPAIVLLLKSNNWPLVRASYLQLANDKEFGTLHTLASSIHELAKVLTPEQIHLDLLPVFYSVAGEFICHLGPAERLPLLEPLLEGYRTHLLNANPARDWRMKEGLISQLGILLNAYDPWESMTHILPLLLDISRSRNVIQVRRWALESLPSFYKAISSDLCEDSGLVGGSLCSSILCFVRRPIVTGWYVAICQRMLQDESQGLNFDTFFLPNLASLVVDPVVDVRFAVVKLLSEVCNGNSATFTLTSMLGPSADASLPYVRHMLARDLLARFKPEDHGDIQSLVDSLTVQMGALTLSP
ncbi:Serine/threonine-protein phosphatase 4 regulatory subunit 1 [Massospora cicadina]|nr:Serine/threonine-protein phosphatase 4 regulatory subunit 1 [Massospora cicadina]